MRFSAARYIWNVHISTSSIIWNLQMDAYSVDVLVVLSLLLKCPILIWCSLCMWWWWWWLSRISTGTCYSDSNFFSHLFVDIHLCVFNFEIVNSNVSLIIWMVPYVHVHFQLQYHNKKSSWLLMILHFSAVCCK